MAMIQVSSANAANFFNSLLAQKPFGGSQVAPLTELEFDRVAVAVDGTVKILRSTADLMYVSSMCHFPMT
jgi:hypothetical protein